MKRKGLFGMFGMVFFLLAVFIIIGMSLFFNISLTALGNPPRLHVNARVVSSEFSNDCDIFLLNVLKFRDEDNNDLTYSQLIAIARETNQGDIMALKLRRLIEDEIVENTLSCLQITAKASSAIEPFINYAPYGNCELKTSSNLCQAYIPTANPEDGYILVKMAVEAI